MKKIIKNAKVMAAGSFLIGWLAGRGTADGFANGEVLIGGVIVGLIYYIVLTIIKDEPTQ